MGTGGNNVPVLLTHEETKYFWRPLTVRECARLQGMSDDFDFSTVSKTQAYKMIGNGFNIPTIAHLLSYLK